MFSLKEETNLNGSNAWCEYWESIHFFNLQGEQGKKWTQSVNMLKYNAIKLLDWDDLVN
jgi:hypothetical protein